MTRIIIIIIIIIILIIITIIENSYILPLLKLMLTKSLDEIRVILSGKGGVKNF